MARRLQRTRGSCERSFPLAAALLSLCLLAPGRAAAEEPIACSGAPDEVRLQLRFSGLHAARGNVTITVYPDDAARFLAKRGKLLRVRVPATAPVTAACLVLPAAGHYAITAYHDENGDHRFNRTLIGLPDEGYGFSNNPKTLTGLPSFESVRFAAQAGDNAIEIRIRY